VARALLLLAALLVLAGCDSRIAAGPDTSTRPKTHVRKQPWPKLPHCPRDAVNCSAARGTIIYVEAVDPDGDGDAHFVLTSDQSITFPGVSVIDVKRSLRPHPLPGVGDRVAAAGPVYRGSHGQRQIEATVLRVARTRER
jgi:hypothetical protein